MICVLEPRFHKPGVKILEWDLRSQRGIITSFRNMHGTKVGLVLNLVIGSLSDQFHVVLNYICRIMW